MRRVSVEQAKERLPDLVEAAVNGDEVVITKDDRAVVKLVRVLEQKPVPRFGSARGSVTMADDFDEPIEDFDEYR